MRKLVLAVLLLVSVPAAAEPSSGQSTSQPPPKTAVAPRPYPPETADAVVRLAAMPRWTALESLNQTGGTMYGEVEPSRRLAELTVHPERLATMPEGHPYRWFKPPAIYEVWTAMMDPELDSDVAHKIRAALVDEVCRGAPACKDPAGLANYYADRVEFVRNTLATLATKLNRAPEADYARLLDDGLAPLKAEPYRTLLNFFFVDTYLHPITRAPTPPNAIFDIDGRTSATVDFPAVALLLRQSGLGDSLSSARAGDMVPYCTGTLIAPSVVLTAAHCICGESASSESCLVKGKPRPNDVRLDPKKYAVLFQGVGLWSVGKFTIHPGYISVAQDGTDTARDPYADIALVFLTKPVTEVKPARLTDTNVPLADAEGAFIGFGAHAPFKKSYPWDVTQLAGTKLHDFYKVSACKSPLSALLCASNSTGATVTAAETDPAAYAKWATGFCVGDSGGPFLLPDRKADAKDWQKYAIVAMAESSKPKGLCSKLDNVFLTDLRPFVGWIHQSIDAAHLPAAKPLANALEPLINPYERVGGRIEMGQFSWLDTESDRVDVEVPAEAQKVVLTVNATCAGDIRPDCARWGFELVVESIDSKIEGCSTTTDSVVLVCNVSLPPGREDRTLLTVSVRIVRDAVRPMDREHTKKLQDFQFAAVAY